MVEINQYAHSLREIIELVVKANDIHEGQWGLLINFQVGIGTFGQADQVFPGAAVTISQIGIQRHPEGAPTTGPGVVVVDAAKVNPKRKKENA